MENLLITTVSRNETNSFKELAKLAGKYDCNISYSRLYAIGSDHSMTVQITGNWSGIAKIESALPQLAKRLEIELVYKRSHQEKIDRYYLPYKIDIFAVDQTGLVYEILEFFTSLEVHIQLLEIKTTSHQQTPILRLNIQVDIPADNNIADIREQFLVFCDELNLDGTMEPDR